MIATIRVETRGRKRDQGRAAEIVRMARFGMTLFDIGKCFGVTRERIRQILKRERSENPEVPSPLESRRQRWICVRFAAEQIGGMSRLKQAVKAGRIEPITIGTHEYVERDKLEPLKAEWKKVRPRCTMCKKFIQHTTGCDMPMCKNCHDTREGTRRRNRRMKQRSVEGMVSHHNSIHALIAERIVRSNDCRLSRSEALQASGLTQMQFAYAKACGLITRKETNRRNNSGGFVCLYSSSEMLQISAMMRELGK